MSSGIYTASADNTHRQAVPGPGMDTRRNWMCGHRHKTGRIRSMGKGLPALLWRCANCAGSPLAAVCADQGQAVGAGNHGDQA